MNTKFIVVKSGGFTIVDHSKNYCKRIRLIVMKGLNNDVRVYYLPAIQGTEFLNQINRVNNTNY